MTELSTLDSILAGSGATAKFENPGDTYFGEIDSIQIRQVNDYDTGKPAFWDDGRPQEQIVVTINTTEQDSPDDDGKRTIYIKGWGDQLKAFRQAAKNLGRNPREGDMFTATYTGDGEKKNPRFNAPKLYKYEFTAGTAGLSNLTDQPATQQSTAHAPGATPTADGDAAAKARQLLQLGLDDQVIADQLGMTPDVIAMLRASL